MGTMTFVRSKPRRLKSGEVRNYYYLVESRWEKGKVRQRVLKYFGTSPNHREISIDPSLAGIVAETLMSGKKTHTKMKEELKKMGIKVGPGKLKKVRLVYKPPQRSLTLCID